jgi:glucose/arabinose dehydrogenase
MTTRSSTRWNLVLVGMLSVLLMTSHAFGQQPTEQPSTQPAAPPAPAQPSAQPAAPPAPAQPPAPPAGQMPIIQPQPTSVPGRPDIPNAEVATQLRGVPPPPFPMPEDKLPIPQLKLPKGFKIEVYASGIANARSLRLGDRGTVFVSNRQLDKVYAIVDRHGKREVKVIASGLDRPNGLAFHNGTLYIAEGAQISKLEKIEDNLDNPPKPVVIYSDFLNHQSHGWKFMGLGPDNKLYVNVGSPCNICEPPATNGQLRRISLDGSSADVVARGVRNSVGFDWHPVTKELYFTDNGRDWLSEDLPEDELNRVTKIGQHFGFPYCHQGTFTDREMGWGRSCNEFEKPVALLGPHSAALGMRFYTGTMFPPEYRNAIFIARHGSWNRTKKVGGDVIAAKLNKDGSVKSWEPFLTGFLQNNEYIGRPVDVQVMKDGSLLVSDDHAGAVYRVTYSSAKVAKR